MSKTTDHEQLIQALPSPLVILDEKQRIQEANPAFLEWVGKKPKSVLGKAAARVLPPLRDALAALAEGTPLYEEQDLFGRYMVVRSAVLHSSNAAAPRSMLMFQDETPRKHVEKALYANERRYRSLFDNNNDAVLVLDHNLTIQLANPRAAQLLGKDLASLLQKGIHQYIPEQAQETFVTHVQALLLGREVPIYESWLQDTEGQRFPVEINLTLVRDAQQEPLEVQMIVRDIREREAARSTLETRLERVSLLHAIDTEVNHTLETESVMQIALRASVDLSGADAGCIALAEEEAIIIRQVMGSYPPDGIGTAIERDHPLVREVVNSGEARYVHDGGLTQDWPAIKATMVFPLVVQDRFIGLLLLGAEDETDFTEDDFEFIQLIASRLGVALENARLHEHVRNQVTELERLNQELRDTERLKTDMLRIANHDLKNPLGIVRGYVSIFEMDQDTLPPEYAEFVESMRNSLDRMETIMDDFLTVEAFKVRAAQAEMATVDLCPLVHKALKEYRDQVAGNNQLLTHTLPEDEAMLVVGDDAQLYEAITNLISNALKYTPEGGTIQVSLQADDAGDVVFQVHDNGYGIPEERQNNLFKPFFRSRTQETVTIEGTGLGLHLVKNIIERHKGEMIFHSIYREGSTFGFRLKRVHDEG